MSKLGLQEATHKAIPPTRTMTWVGIQFCLDTMTMTIPPSKIADTLQLVHHWLTQRSITRRQLQSLTGSLAHVSRCCPAGRLFTGRLYDMLANSPSNCDIQFTDGAKRDLTWFASLLSHFKGIRLMRQYTVDITVTADSCLTGAGAATDEHFYSVKYPQTIVARTLPITQLEMLNLLVLMRLWGPQWKTLNVLLYSDNAAAVATLQSARAHNNFLRAAAREIWLIAATHDISLTVRHRPGASLTMQTADALSRAHLTSHFNAMITNLQRKGVKRTHVPSRVLADPLAHL